MNFIAPEFLYALGFLAIPILIHLFNFRRYKTVQFSQVKFLKSIKKQTQSTSKLKHFIVLVCRCLAISFLVFAFAQPYFSDEKIEKSGEKKGVLVYLDNSFSMQMGAEVGSLLDEAKNKALAIANAHSAADKFQLHTNDFLGEDLRWLNKEAFITKLQNINYSSQYRGIEGILTRLQSGNNNEKLDLNYYLISDLQKSSFETKGFIDSLKINILPVKSQLNDNTWIDDFTSFQPFHLPSMAEQFSLQVKHNTASQSKNVNGKLILNGQVKNPFVVNLNSDSVEQNLNFTNPLSSEVFGKIALKDYPVVFDDTFYFHYPTNKKIKILQLFEDINNTSIRSLYEKDSLFNFTATSVKQIDFSMLQSANLVILENVKTLSTGLVSELTNFTKNGGNLVLFPSMDMDQNSINGFLNQFAINGYNTKNKDTLEINALNTNAGVFTNVFEESPENINFPKVFRSWSMKSENNVVTESIFKFANGADYLNKVDISGAKIYLFGGNLESNNSTFGKHALFVPVMYNVALQSALNKKTSYLIGSKKITLNNINLGEAPLKLKRGNREWIPKQRINNNSVEIYLRNQIKEPGFYSVRQNNETIETLAFNYNRKESNLNCFDVTEFKIQAEKSGLKIQVFESGGTVLSKELNDFGKATKLWKYCIILCLLFIGLEILFLRIL